jgi:hypothetical protein
MIERISTVVAERRAGLVRARASVHAPTPESAVSLMARVRKFFKVGHGKA